MRTLILVSALSLLLSGCPGPPVSTLPMPNGYARPYIEHMFEVADCSGDQKMTSPEARTVITIRIGDTETFRPMTEAEFQQGDANKDQYMTVEEFGTLVNALDISGYQQTDVSCPANTTSGS